LEVSPPPGPGEEESDVSNKQQRIAEALERRDAEIKRQALRIAALEGERDALVGELCEKRERLVDAEGKEAAARQLLNNAWAERDALRAEVERLRGNALGVSVKAAMPSDTASAPCTLRPVAGCPAVAPLVPTDRMWTCELPKGHAGSHRLEALSWSDRDR
jgi:hypothetical protein